VKAAVNCMFMSLSQYSDNPQARQGVEQILRAALAGR